MISATAILLFMHHGGDAPVIFTCQAGEEKSATQQQPNLRESDLHWALAVSARDDDQDPIRATHHFLAAARAAALAGDESRAENCLIAASFPAQSLDRYLIHSVKGAVFSPDSTRLLTYNDSGVAWLWDVTQTEPLQSFRHEKQILRAQFNTDATRVLTYSRDGTVRLWKIGQENPPSTFSHDDEVTGALFTSDETRILSWSKDKTARIWDVNQPDKPLLTFQHEGPVTSAALNTEETRLLTGGDDFSARLSNAKTGQLIRKFVYEPRDELDSWMKSKVSDVAFCDDDAHISFQTYDGTYLLDAATGKQIGRYSREFTGSEPRFINEKRGVISFYHQDKGDAFQSFRHGINISHELDARIAEFNDDRTRFLTLLDYRYYGYTGDGWVQLWETDGEKPLRTFHHDGVINGAAFAPDADRILTYSGDGTARLWDVSQGYLPRTIRHRRGVKGALLSPDGKLLLTWTDRGTARLTELGRADRGEPIGECKAGYPGYLRWIRLPPKGLEAVAWDPYEKTIPYVDVARHKTVRTFTIDTNVNQVTVSPDGDFLLAVGDKAGWLFALNQDEPLATFEGAIEGQVVFNSDASLVFLETRAAGVLFDINQRKILKTFPKGPERNQIASVVFTAEGVRILTPGTGHLHLWKIDGDSPLRSFPYELLLEKAIYSPDGTRFLTWSKLHKQGVTASLWHVNDPQQRHRFPPQTGFDQAEFSPDGAFIVSWSNSVGDPVQLWDADRGELVTDYHLPGHIAYIRFMPDGNRFVTVSWEQQTQLWDHDHEKPLRTFQHSKLLRVPAFADGGASFLAQADGKVFRWNLGVDRTRTIEQQQQDYERKTATRLDASGRLQPLSFADWQKQFSIENSP